MKVAIAGWFGADNVGDEVLLSTTAALVQELDAGAEVVALAADPARTRQQHGFDALPLAATSRLDKITGFWDKERLEGFHAVLLGPGTVFQERRPGLPWPGTLPALARVAVVARRAGARLSTFGAGVREGGTRLGSAVLTSIARSCVEVGVRDLATARLLPSPCTSVIGDVASAWTPPAPVGWSTGDTFAVSARPGTGTAGVTATLEVAVEHLGRLGLSGLAFPFALGRGAAGEDDRAVLAAGPFATLRQVPPPFPGQFGGAEWLAWSAALRSCRIMVATRLHAAVLTLAMGVPVVAVPYERKVATTMDDLGLAGHLIDPTWDAARVRAAIDAALADTDLVARAQDRLQVRAADVRASLRRALGA